MEDKKRNKKRGSYKPKHEDVKRLELFLEKLKNNRDDKQH